MARLIHNFLAEQEADTIESYIFIKTKKLLKLSSQNLIDCSTEMGNLGCNGGALRFSYNYVLKNGINTESCYPYEAGHNTCRFNKSCTVAQIAGYVRVPSDEETLKLATYLNPISVGVNSDLSSFKDYSSGIYYDPNCTSKSINHAMTIVGYGTDSSTKMDYWLLKNSWGNSWGESGYMRLARNANNMCGVANQAYFPNFQ